MYLAIVTRTSSFFTMKVILEIPDHQASFGLQVLKSLSFVKKAMPMSGSAEKLLKDLNESAEDVRLHKAGQLKLKSAQELFNEL